MISEEKLMQNLLRDYFICQCQLYVNTNVSTRVISNQINISPATIKRALTLAKKRKEACLELLPKAFEMALNDGILSKEEYIDEEVLSSLDEEIDMTTYMLKKNNKWGAVTLDPNEVYFTILEAINNKYFSNPCSLMMTVEEVKKLKDSGKSYQEIADILGITKTTAYNYYRKATSFSNNITNNGKINVKGR